MSNTTITPNMGLVLPTIGVDPGPDWATNLNASLTSVDSHNHTAGQGVQITPAAINVNSDLPLNNNNLTLARTLRLKPQSAAPSGASDLGCLTEIGVDLYYIDGSGNVIRLTQSGAPTGATGTITGLPSGTASASFAGTTFTFQSSTSTPASMNFGPTTIGQDVSGGFGVTISASSSQAANYNLALPSALPASTKIVTLDNSGNLAAQYDVDNSTLQVSSNLLGVKPLGITNGDLATTNLSVGGNASVTITATSFTTFANLTLSGVSTRVKMLLLQPYPGNNAGIYANSSSRVRFLRDGTDIGEFQMDTGTGLANFMLIDPSSTTGSHTYQAQGLANGGAGSPLVITNMQFLVVEL